MNKSPKSEFVLPLGIILVAPTPGVDFGIQEGKGHDYKTIQTQRAKEADLKFECSVSVKGNREDGPPNFLGAIVQGPPTGRFIYIDIGKSAGQFNSNWERRIKNPLLGITWEMIEMIENNPTKLLQAKIPGTGKDGGPSCATVKPIDGWTVNVNALG